VKHKYCKPYPCPTGRGFTLLEVLVALVIVSLGMIAVFGQLNQMLSASGRLRDKTLAHWIAVDQITELQAIHAYPKVGERHDELDMARATWSYTVKISQIGDLAMRRVDVAVAFADTPKRILAEVSGFIAPPLQGGTGGNLGGGGQSGQPQLDDDGNPIDPTSTSNQPAGTAVGTGDQPTGDGFGRGWEPLNPNEYQSDGS
jgi:general secretion pathway protein I